MELNRYEFWPATPKIKNDFSVGLCVARRRDPDDEDKVIMKLVGSNLGSQNNIFFFEPKQLSCFRQRLNGDQRVHI